MSRTRHCSEIVDLPAPCGHPRPRTCNRHIGWWASWFTDRCCQHLTGNPAWLAWVLLSPSLAWYAFTYSVRPYDMVADRRRWWWQVPYCWRTTRRGREMQRRLTEAINKRDGGA